MVDTRDARAFASELKFVLDAAVAKQVREWARAELAPDPHGTGPHGDEYQTTSLYFDTDGHDVFHRRGSFGRAKYRVRRYSDSDFVFLERKLRKPGIVVKRRTRASIDILGHLGRPEPGPDWPGRWFHRRLLARGLRPVCQLTYHRMARSLSLPDAPARLTLDEGANAAPLVEAHFNGSSGTPILDRQLILELKFRGYLPSIFKRLVEEFRLAPAAVSKYRFGMMVLGHVRHDDSRAPGGTSAHV